MGENPVKVAILPNSIETPGQYTKAANFVTATKVPSAAGSETEPESSTDLMADEAAMDGAGDDNEIVASQHDPNPPESPNALPDDDTKKDEAKADLVAQQDQNKQQRSSSSLDDGAKRDETAEVADESAEVASVYEIPKRKPTIPQPRKVNFEGFKNRFSEDEDIYALDVLVAGGDLMDDIHREMVTRKAKVRNGKRGGGQAQIPKASIRPKEGGWIQRVRIQSEPIISHLSKAVGESWPRSTPVTFRRPFMVLIYFHDRMKEALAELESKWADEERQQLEEKAVSKASKKDEKASEDGVDDNDDSGDPADPIADSVEALRDMRCYVKFVNDEILPLTKRFDGTDRRSVHFDDLWLLFNVGDLVWASGAMASAAPGSRTAGMYQPLWRVYTLNEPNDAFKYPKLDSAAKPQQPNEDNDDDEDSSTDNKFKIWAYYIDHDGVSYGAVKHGFTISRYSGEREITDLPCYPIRFDKDSDTHIAELTAQGKKFELYLERNHLIHDGWTLISKPDGEPMDGKPDAFGTQRRLQPEYIDSHVIVDLAEAFHDMADWKPTFHKPTIYSDEWSRVTDDFPIFIWSNEERSKLIAKSNDEVQQVTDGVTMWERKDWLAKDTFLKASGKQSLGFNVQSTPVLGPEHYALLPRRLFAYVLKDRKVVCVDIKNLEPTSAKVGVFDTLKIDKRYKAMVKGLVSSHFAKKTLERTHFGASRARSQSQDIIQGKGRGLVILLHGVPGVGKTATAEAVAMENHKPLFAITCGDLGLTPKEVEGSLNEIFRLAHMWNCVLLFDEADVFLAQRSRFDLKRNALVSVFLRTLEYYNGILFLTTNRVGTLDEAFKSRIHMSLYYPPLNEIQIKLIFKMNIDKLREIEEERTRLTNEPMLDIRDESILEFAKDHCLKTQKSGRWNGRQIRNAFQIASSLARYNAYVDHETELEKNKGAELKSPVLDFEQFGKVEAATEAFTRYLEETKGFNDADLAQIFGERNDLFQQKAFSAGVTGTAAGAGGAASAASYQHQAHYNYSYGAPNNPVIDHAAQGVQFPAGIQGPMNFGPPDQGEPVGHGVGGPYNTPIRARPVPVSFGTPPNPGSVGRGNGFAGNNTQGQAHGYGQNPHSPPGQGYGDQGEW
ncbi:hypothetical protein F4679DRAFT_555588 [Xylaria curta]|nr:hypothetical protein F4679DRAFT_555588 [Xylaria curta]